MPEWINTLVSVRNLLPPLNFLTLHYAYFMFVGLLSAVIFWGASKPSRSIDFTDALFLCFSAMTGAGLNTINLSTINTFQQAILLILILLGHPVLISSTVLIVRMRAFQSRFISLLESRRGAISARIRRRDSSHRWIPSLSRTRGDNPPAKGEEGMSSDFNPHHQPVPTQLRNRDVHTPVENQTLDSTLSATEKNENSHTGPSQDLNIRWADEPSDPFPARGRTPTMRLLPMAGVGARPSSAHPKYAAPVPENQRASSTERPSQFSTGYVSRNSQFFGLSLADREKLGGVEYRAVAFLAVIVPLYFFLFNLLGFIGVGSWLTVNRPEVATSNGVGPFWAGGFMAVSAFGNNGMSLLDANMTVLQTGVYPLLTMSFLILAGNTLYPCFLRFIVWIFRKSFLKGKKWADRRMVLDFILQHPRRVYTNLFPSRHTWYLLGTIVILNGIDWVAFEVLSIGNPTVQDLGSYRVLDGLFQAFAVRSGGFYIVNIANLRQGLLVLYVLMMYVSAFPVLLTIRNTNVYEERSLGVYADDNIAKDQRHSAYVGGFFDNMRTLVFHRSRSKSSSTAPNEPVGDAPDGSRSFFVRQQIRSQLSHDTWWISLAILFIAIAEASSFEADPVNFSTFNIIFEVVSAYGCVGISVGVPNQNYSFSGAWNVISKLILIAVMLRGRHRGLPVAIDKAVMLPSESLHWAEEEDAVVRSERSRSRLRTSRPLSLETFETV